MLLKLPGPFESRGYSIGVLRADIGKCFDAYKDWLARRSLRGMSFHVLSTFESALQSLEPFDRLLPKKLLLETRGEWTVMLDNRPPYPDTSSAVSVLTQDIACEGVIATSIPEKFGVNGERTSYGRIQLEILSETKTSFLNIRRSICLAHAEEGWRFDSFGDPLHFEDVRRYALRRVRDRFDEALLIRYLHDLGIECDCPDWYTGNAALLRWGNLG